MSLFKSAFTIGIFTLCSRILGYVRDIFIASYLGTSFLADAYFVAFRVPNLFRQLSAEGALNNSFVPLFSAKMVSSDKKSAVEMAGHVLSVLIMFLTVILIVFEIFMPFVMHMIAPGFRNNPEQFEVVVELSRIIFPYILFISATALMSGMLNSIGKFAVPAATPMLLNVCVITSFFLFAGYTETPAHSMAWGVAMSGVIQVIIFIAVTRKYNIMPKLYRPEFTDDVKTLLRRMVPGVIGGGVNQINVLINTIIATMLPGAVSYLYYSDRLLFFPIAIIGTALGTAILPLLSRQIRSGDSSSYFKTQNQALEVALILAIPCATAFFVVAEPIISVMFERGKFTHESTLATASVLGIFCIGLPAVIMTKIFAPVFFASGDTKTPVKISIICIMLDTATSITMMQFIGYKGIACGAIISSWFNASSLFFILRKRGMFKPNYDSIKRIVRIIVSAAVMGILLSLQHKAMSEYFSASLTIQIIALAVLIISGVVIFFTVAHITGGCRIKDLRKNLRQC